MNNREAHFYLEELQRMMTQHRGIFSEEFVCANGMAIQALEKAQEQRWTPVSERLPEEGQGCLVCDKGSILIDTFIGHGNPYNWKWYIRDYEAWMPLPEPYKGGEQDE